MAVSGTINVSASFLDSAQTGGVESEKKLTLSGSNLYTTGKVAVISGTCGTTGVTITVVPSAYTNAAGNTVSFFTGVARVAFSTPGQAVISAGNGASALQMFSREGSVSVTDTFGPQDYQDLTVKSLVPSTTSFTVLIYGD